MPPPNNYFGNYRDPAPGYPGGGGYYPSTPPPPQGPPLFGLGGNQGGSMGGLAQSLMPMIAEMFRGQFGGYGFMFGSDMNIASARMANQYLQQLGEARNRGAEADQAQLKQIFQGLAVAIGNPMTKNQDTGRMELSADVQKSIDVLSRDASMMLPMLAAAFPDTLDRVLPRGSMTVAAASFVNAGRFVVDPATGRAAIRDPNMAARVLAPLLDQGPQATFGLGAGRLGQIYEELVQRGMVGSGGDLRESVEAREKTRGLFGIGMGGDEARNIQASRIRDRVQAYSGAISAINDIFAENGKTNASMAELVTSLEEFSQGGMTTFDPARLARIGRNIQSAAQVSGLGIQGLSQLSAFAAASLEQFGGNRALASSATMKAAAYGMVFANRNFGQAGAETVSRGDFLEAVIGNQAAFAGSPVANMIGAISATGRFAPEGSDFAALASAVRRGETRVTLPSGRTVDLTANPAAVGEIARQSGVGGAYMQQLMATRMNQAEFVREQGLIGTDRRLQASEFESTLSRLLGVSGDNPELLNALYEAARNGENDTFKIAQFAGGKLGMSANQQGELAAKLGQLSQYTRGKSPAAALRLFDRRVFEDAAKSQKFIEDRGIKIEEMSGLMRGGWQRNITNSIIQMGTEKGLQGIPMTLLQMLGMVTNEDIAGALSGDGPPIDHMGDAVFDFIFNKKKRPEFQSVLGGLGVVGSHKTPQAPDAPTGPGFFGRAFEGIEKGRKTNPFLGAGATGFLGGIMEEVADQLPPGAQKKADAGDRGPLVVQIAELILKGKGAELLQTDRTAVK